MPTPDRCLAAPAGESHRWRLPAQGTTGPAVCKWCGGECTFAAWTDATRWDTAPQHTHRDTARARGTRASHRPANLVLPPWRPDRVR